jgi:hypothetical protein
MRSLLRTGWRREVLVGLLASVLTGAVLVPLGWAALEQQRERTEEASRRALQAERAAQQDVEPVRDPAQQALVDKAADALSNLGGPERADIEALRATTRAVTPEVPQGAYMLIDKKASTYNVGDIVVYRLGGNKCLGRVLAVEKEFGRLRVGRNQEPERHIPLSDVLGRGVVNTR